MRNALAQLRQWKFGNRIYQISLLVFIAALVKVAIARNVAVNGDTGLYLYDAQQILMGRIQFVDFPSRSPLFEHLLALAIWLGESPLASARTLMLIISLALGVAVYALARQLHSHRAGIVSMALFYFTPFSLTWGAWVKTEQAAALTTVTAFVIALYAIDQEDLPTKPLLAVGALFAMSYLIRRVAIVHIGAFAIFVIWYRYHSGYTTKSTVKAAGIVLATATATLFGGYLLLVRGDPALAWRVFDSHTLALFESSGQGSLGWIYLSDPVAITAESRPGWVFQICQKCGVNTAQVFAQTTMVILPALVAGLLFARAGLRQLDDFVTDYGVPVVIGVPMVWKFTRDWARMEPLVSGSLAVLTVVVFVVWFSRPVDWRDVWNPKVALPVIVCLSLAAGYLYRDRIIYTTYFQDFFPFVAAIAGIALVEWWKKNNRLVARSILVVVILTTAIVAGLHADPYRPTAEDTDAHWFTPNSVAEYGDDIDERIPGGGPVFTAQPLYVIESDSHPLSDLSRKYYLFRAWPDDPLTDDVEANIVDGLNSGRAQYAINDTNLDEITSESPPIRAELRDHYCPVNAPIYNRTGAELMVHESTGECA